MHPSIKFFFLSAVLAGLSMVAHAAKLKPYSLAQQTSDQMNLVIQRVRTKLQNANFEIIGTYRPYPEAHIFAVTSEELKQTAAKTEYGGFGAIIKVAITEVQSEQGVRRVDVTYNNPHYVGLAYNMQSILYTTKNRLKNAIGFIEDFGGGEGIEAEELPEYNYAFGLEGFYGFFDFADHGSYQKAIRKVEQGLANNKFGIGQVYKLSIPGKQQTVYGLSLKSDKEELPFLNDQYVMHIIDHRQPRRSAHLPYEIMVTGGKVIAMHPHFRLAVNFPDLHMFGTHSFGRLMNLPYDYQEYLTQVVGGEWPPGGDSW